MCRCLGTCVFGQVRLLPRQCRAQPHSLPWLHKGHSGVMCTLRTLLTAQLGMQWPFLSRILGKQGEQQIPNHPIGSRQQACTLARRLPANLQQGRAATFISRLLQTRVPDCRMNITISALTIGAVLHCLCCFPMFPHSRLLGRVWCVSTVAEQLGVWVACIAA